MYVLRIIGRKLPSPIFDSKDMVSRDSCNRFNIWETDLY